MKAKVYQFPHRVWFPTSNGWGSRLVTDDDRNARKTIATQMAGVPLNCAEYDRNTDRVAVFVPAAAA